MLRFGDTYRIQWTGETRKLWLFLWRWHDGDRLSAPWTQNIKRLGWQPSIIKGKTHRTLRTTGYHFTTSPGSFVQTSDLRECAILSLNCSLLSGLCCSRWNIVPFLPPAQHVVRRPQS